MPYKAVQQTMTILNEAFSGVMPEWVKNSLLPWLKERFAGENEDQQLRKFEYRLADPVDRRVLQVRLEKHFEENAADLKELEKILEQAGADSAGRKKADAKRPEKKTSSAAKSTEKTRKPRTKR